MSEELKSMVKTETPAMLTTAEKSMNKLLAALTLGLTITVIALSVSVARLSNEKSSKMVTAVVSTTPTFNKGWSGENPCTGTKVELPNIKCTINEIEGDETSELIINEFALGTAEQSGVNVTKGYNGSYDTSLTPILEDYFEIGMCPVNVHWHLGAEHYSLGEFDENGKGPSDKKRRQLAGKVRLGYQCHHYDETDKAFTTEYDWKHCVNTHVGDTYEVHWPHSGMGSCATVNQFQTPFYDGVFCRMEETGLLLDKIGVQGQVFTIVNDERYYYPDLMRGMIKDGDYGKDMATYTGSTTGTSRDNEFCSQYTGITWKVDRKCHLISASSFDKMCADMKAQRDDMSDDLYPHGARELVLDEFAADNHSTRNRKKLRALKRTRPL